MIRRQAQILTSAPGATPPTYTPGFILGWGIDSVSGESFILWEDSASNQVEQRPVTPNTYFLLDGHPLVLPQF